MNPQKSLQRRRRSGSHRLSQRMLHLVIACLIVWLAATGAAAQVKQSALGARLSVVSPNADIPLNQETPVEIRFLDARGNHVPATADLNVTITASVSGDLIAARRSVSPQSVRSLDGAGIVLPRSAEHAVTQGYFPAGYKSVWVKFRAERGGPIKLIAEGAGMLAGHGTINVQGPCWIAVKVNSPKVSPKKDVTITITLLDYHKKETAPPNDFSLTVTATMLGGLGETRSLGGLARLYQPQQNRSLEGQTLALTRGGTAKLTGIFPKNANRVTLRFRSDLTGVIRVFVEGAGLNAGFAPVSVAQQSQEAWPSSKPAWSLLPAFFTTQPVMRTPALWQPCAPRQARLEIKLVDETARGDFNQFFVVLVDSAGKSVNATCDIPISLGIPDELRKTVSLTQTQDTIRAGSYFSSIVEIESKCNEQVRLSARTQADGVSSSSKVIPFKPQRRATSLKLSPSPRQEVANGLAPIYLTVTALDSCGSAISMKDEGKEEVRPVIFDFPHSLRFDGGQPALPIPADKSSGTIKIYSSRPVSEMPVVARSSNVLGEWIESGGEGAKVSFTFPFLELICAMLGGCLLPLIALWKKRNWTELVKGAVTGAVTYGAAMFGAIATGTAAWGALVVKMTSFPADSAFGAGIVGLFGYGLVTGAGMVKTLAKKTAPGEAESGAS